MVAIYPNYFGLPEWNIWGIQLIHGDIAPEINYSEGDMPCILSFNFQKFTYIGKNLAHKIRTYVGQYHLRNSEPEKTSTKALAIVTASCCFIGMANVNLESSSWKVKTFILF